jgi:hypothetical protein
MRFSTSALCRGVLAITVLGSITTTSACGEKTSAAPASDLVSDGLTDTQRGRLKGAPLAELSFVPAEVEGLVRVDLGSLAERDEQTAQALLFTFKAQQPAAAEILERGNLRIGRELRVLYFVVGAAKDDLLIAGVGDFEPTALAEELGRRGERGLPQLGAQVFHWPAPEVGRYGATDLGPVETTPELGPTSIALAPGLILVGKPAMVTAALEARAQKRKDVRTTPPLVRELLAVDVSAAVWGVGQASSAESWLPRLAPGAQRVRFHGALVDRGSGTLHLEAHFGNPEQATAFAKQLAGLLRMVAAIAPASSPLGKTLARVKQTAKIDVEDRTVRAVAAL